PTSRQTRKMRQEIVVTNGLNGTTGEPSAMRMPPTEAVTAKNTLSTGTHTGEAESCVAAAARVQSRARTSRAQTNCTLRATARPRVSMKTMVSAETGTPLALATPGSRLANISGLHTMARTTSTASEQRMRVRIWPGVIATI